MFLPTHTPHKGDPRGLALLAGSGAAPQRGLGQSPIHKAPFFSFEHRPRHTKGDGFGIVSCEVFVPTMMQGCVQFVGSEVLFCIEEIGIEMGKIVEGPFPSA